MQPRQFARAKPKAIVIAARNAEKLKETEALALEVEPTVEIVRVPTDVTKEDSVKSLFDTVQQKFGRADVLVNNAGVSVGHTNVDMMELDDYWQNFEVNVKGVLLTTKYFLRLLGDATGTIINISSQAAWNEPEVSAGYCLSKLAIVKLCRQMSWRPNVSVVALHPGTVKSDIVPEFFWRFAEDTPALAGGTAVWLTTEEARFMSGRFISANWCVKELVARKEEIEQEGLCKVGMIGTVGLDQFK
ncbi:3-oxoacyl-(acyl-carrier-protein) reductase [Talaromyces pinophilus]|uniref:3-oxoacyl-(Acyl-carrier-protein) reductase n=1 Tax=Talaromyces pinophilus TaxID=128442 RepID=A0A6V8H2W4_TALPI|nr:3-oxoacyl-(acyl-carrier-protein) reductase [Talaromyces pinophilus]